MPQGQTESGSIVLAAICWAPSAQTRCHPEEALYLPTFSHLLIVNKPLSLSLSLFLRLRLTVGWALIPPLSGYHVPADGSGKEERLVVERDW